MKKIGVIIPSFNEELYIGKTLQSYCEQKHVEPEDYFVVVVDNGSTDATLQIVTKIQKKTASCTILITKENRLGVRYARKKGFDTAIQYGATELLNTDADTPAPSTMIEQVKKTAAVREPVVIRGKIFFPEETLLLMIVHMKKIMVLFKQLRLIEEKLFGPTLSGGYFVMPSMLYKHIYMGDIVHPLIQAEDHLLGRRLWYQGATFVDSSNFVVTSDRRFLADIMGWTEGDRSKNYRTIQKKEILQNIGKLSYEDVKERRIRHTADRFLRQLVDALFLYNHDTHANFLARSSYMNFCSFFHLPESVVKNVSFDERFGYYHDLKKKYLKPVTAQLIKLTGSV